MAQIGDSQFDRQPDGFFCTGSLIDPYTVVTAAHCIEAAANFESYVVVRNQTASSDHGQVLMPRTSRYYDFDSNTLAGDLALIDLCNRISDLEVQFLKKKSQVYKNITLRLLDQFCGLETSKSKKLNLIKEVKKETFIDQYKKPYFDLTTQFQKLEEQLKICDCNFIGLPAIRFKAVGISAIQVDSIMSGVAQKLIEHPSCKIKVVGYCDATKKTIAESKLNAQWVANYLINRLGISETRIQIFSGIKGDASLVQLEGVYE